MRKVSEGLKSRERVRLTVVSNKCQQAALCIWKNVEFGSSFDCFQHNSPGWYKWPDTVRIAFKAATWIMIQISKVCCCTSWFALANKGLLVVPSNLQDAIFLPGMTGLYISCQL